MAVLVLENNDFGSAVGSGGSPYVSGLARRSALATRYYGVSHPSLPNYLALTAGLDVRDPQRLPLPRAGPQPLRPAQRRGDQLAGVLRAGVPSRVNPFLHFGLRLRAARG